MTGPGAPLPDPGLPAGGPGPRWIRWLLVASLAFNLAVLGVMGGAALRFRGAGMHATAVRDLSLGQFTEALSRQDREVLRQAFIGDPVAFRSERRKARADFERILAALRAEPFDPDQFRAGLDRQKARIQARLDLGQRLLSDLIARMPTDERLQFADRFQAVLDRRPELHRPPPTGP